MAILCSQESWCKTKDIALVLSAKFASVHRLSNFEQIAVFFPQQVGLVFANACISEDVDSVGNITISLEGNMNLGLLSIRDYLEEYEIFTPVSQQFSDDLSTLLISLSTPSKHIALLFDTSIITLNSYVLQTLQYYLNLLSFLRKRCLSILRTIFNEWSKDGNEWKEILKRIGRTALLFSHEKIPHQSSQQISQSEEQLLEGAKREIMVLQACGPVTPSLQHSVSDLLQSNIRAALKQHNDSCDTIDGLLCGHLVPTIRHFVCAISDLIGIVKQGQFLPFELVESAFSAQIISQTFALAADKLGKYAKSDNISIAGDEHVGQATFLSAIDLEEALDGVMKDIVRIAIGNESFIIIFAQN
ncbi:MAG: hypothetical protein EZS28_027308 [Streblomastix strix]|uniref:Uncharacterized protein n=1 Tax=Streblomastix strix TaxID=222440 RepID=A0A5J4V4Z9_9EUKA|nr:MAG: hypothetical protein EZS28_027308 [Streblomastix strix]